MHVYRDFGRASDEELDEIHGTATRLLDDYERYLGGDLVEALCVLREAAVKTKRRRSEGNGSVVRSLRKSA